jgi:hypothetical protein
MAKKKKSAAAKEPESTKEHLITHKDGKYFNRKSPDGFFYAGPLFVGLAFCGEKLFCPTCGIVMERNTSSTDWFRCITCKYSYNVLDKLPADHPIFIGSGDEG